jgi:hypothetical protein
VGTREEGVEMDEVRIDIVAGRVFVQLDECVSYFRHKGGSIFEKNESFRKQ